MHAFVINSLRQRRAAREGAVKLGGLPAYTAERALGRDRKVLAGDVEDEAGASIRNVEVVWPRAGAPSAVQRPELFDFHRAVSDVVHSVADDPR